ncbi:helix-turn-helix domain-containing protein [Rhodococcus sp. 1.20]|uniref:helix-turn-helix domain-containing protein n=1 Tax=Rhodococcus sp. 311R TaxID=1617904 RepID=UPI00067E9F42|nr:helix-turn-helix transcriptional regulator [Rhodococcus sp. 311R]
MQPSQDDWSEWERVAILQVGRAVKDARSAAGFSQRALAEKSSLDRGQIANLEGVRDDGSPRLAELPRLGVIVRLAYALGIPPVSLIYPGLPAGKVEMLPGVTTSSIEAVQWFSGENVQIPQVDFDPTDTLYARRYSHLRQVISKIQTDKALSTLGVENVELSDERMKAVLTSVNSELAELEERMRERKERGR